VQFCEITTLENPVQTMAGDFIMAIFSNKTMEEWIDEYADGHRHPVNQRCHAIGIPLIVISLLLIPIAFIRDSLWVYSGALFILGWVFQFVGHIFERKPPEFFKDWRFLFVGLRWWFYKVVKSKKSNEP
jgi:uncharacterized membrane protein YGL010W